MAIRYLGLDDWLLIAAAFLECDPGVVEKSADLCAAEAALNAPAARYGGQELYPEFETKVGVLGYQLAHRRPLADASGGVALLCMVEFSERNAHRWAIADDDELYRYMNSATGGGVSEGAFVVWAAKGVD